MVKGRRHPYSYMAVEVEQQPPVRPASTPQNPVCFRSSPATLSRGKSIALPPWWLETE
jgi:hypothetical protein